jgi:WD repeat-containing protein 68
MSPNLIVTSSIDTTCTVWDISTSAAVTQLIAHDREVYDVAWVPGSVDAFVSVGADGSLRAFDLRSLEHSTILYETPSNSGKKPASTPSATATHSNSSGALAPGSGPVGAASLLRLAFNPYDANYLATFHTDSADVQVLDMRSPGRPVVELKGHRGAISSVGWSRQDSGIVASAGDDCQVLVWDLGAQGLYSSHASSAQARSPHPEGSGGSSQQTRTSTEPMLAYTAPGEVNNLAWSPNLIGGAYTREDGRGAMGPSGEWVAIAAGRSIRALKV